MTHKLYTQRGLDYCLDQKYNLDAKQHTEHFNSFVRGWRKCIEEAILGGFMDEADAEALMAAKAPRVIEGPESVS